MNVFIANFGYQNYLWPECFRRPSVANYTSEDVFKFWEAGDRPGYIEYTMSHYQNVNRGKASTFYGHAEAMSTTSGDIWIHREKQEFWWATTLSAPLEIEAKASTFPERDGPRICEMHKPTEPWSDRTRKGVQLSWNGLHPKAQDFLFFEGTLQQLSPDNAAYALALIDGDDLSPWHDLPVWKAKSKSKGRNAATRFDARQRAIWRMVDTVKATVAQANGQEVLRTLKNKLCAFTEDELKAYLSNLIEVQDGLCAITGLALQFDGDFEDRAMLCSLDRIDSAGHYEPGNLQVVCQFVNRWKGDTADSEFRRLLQEVRSVS
jgi:hypothetical protein